MADRNVKMLMAKKQIISKKGSAGSPSGYLKSLMEQGRAEYEQAKRMAAGKLKVCVTYLGPKARARKVCRVLTKRQIAKLIRIPKGAKISSVTRF